VSTKTAKVVALPARPAANAIGPSRQASVVDAKSEERLMHALAVAYIRELDLSAELCKARRERQALIRRVNCLSAGAKERQSASSR
jgi:hypothetical protein